MILSDTGPVQQWDPSQWNPKQWDCQGNWPDPFKGISLTVDFFDHVYQPCPVLDARAARWQEHAFNHMQSPDVPLWTQGNVIELARFPVPPGFQGRVSVLETAILGLVPGTTTPLPPNAFWFPEYYTAMLADWPNSRGRAFSFYLRLENYRREGLPVNARLLPTRQDLPGNPYPPLGEWNDTRYDFSRRCRTSLTIPDEKFLTLWVEIVGRDIDRLAGLWGRLGGVVQLYRDNPQAITESRRWHATT